MEPQGRPLRLLSLDGGGVRGLSSILILDDIMTGLSREYGRQMQPWEVFDMIGGTSTGGLIAIMLGRLHMSLEECQRAYLNLSKRIFNPKRPSANILGRAHDFLQTNGRFDARELEDAIKETLQSRNLPEDELLKDLSDGCKVFVCAMRTSNSEPAILRSYENPKMPKLLFDECQIWEACRATSAATTFFDPIIIGPMEQKFADGAVLYNNPIQLVYREAQGLWGRNRVHDALLVSIGTGSAPGQAFEGNIKNIVEAMKKIVTQTEKTANSFFLDHEAMVDRDLLYRFNVYHGLADVGLEEWKQTAKMADATQTYLSDGETRRKVERCIAQFSSVALEGN